MIPRFKLEALHYPRVEQFLAAGAGDLSEVANLVVFLEDRYVRALAIDARTPLRKASPAWHAAFAAYLQELECPLVGDAAYDPTALASYLQWLVGHAVAAEYEEMGEELNAAAAALAAAGGASAAPAPAVPAAAPVAESSAALVRQLAELLHVSADGRDAVACLQACHRVIRQRVLPAAAQAEAGASSSSGGSGGAASSSSGGSGGKRGRGRPAAVPTPADILNLHTFPLGFATGDAVVDKAASILRMLYVTDLRELQDAVNDILVSVQELTARKGTAYTEAGLAPPAHGKHGRS